MQVKPWFSNEVGKDFLKWENGGDRYYHDVGKDVTRTGKTFCARNDKYHLLVEICYYETY